MARRTAGARESLTRKDWAEAAIAVMVRSSVEQVRVEKLAAELGVSKGSFYWHFADRNELLMEILEEWKSKATLAVQARIEKIEPLPERQLLLLMQLPFRSEAALRAADLELAIQGWARRSPAAQRAVESVDQMRVDHIAKLLRQVGLPAPEAEYRAHKGYALLRYAAQRRDMETSDRIALTLKVHGELIAQAD